jgi:hypothetical protein
METTIVESTTLARIGYDAANQLLQLEFRDKTTYQYFGVPAKVHTELLVAPSKGQYFNRSIRGHFRYSAMPSALDS